MMRSMSPSIHRQSGVLALPQLREDLVPGVLDVDADDLDARNHDVLDGGVLEIENAHQHLLVTLRDHGSGFGHDAAQLLAAQRVRGLLARHAKQTQCAVGEQIRCPDERIERPEQRGIHISRRQCETLGMQRAEGLRRDLAEDQQDERERDDADGHQIVPAQAKGDQADQRGRHDVDHGAQQQDEPDQPVRMGE